MISARRGAGKASHSLFKDARAIHQGVRRADLALFSDEWPRGQMRICSGKVICRSNPNRAQTLAQCWANVADVGTALNQRLVWTLKCQAIRKHSASRGKETGKASDRVIGGSMLLPEQSMCLHSQ